MAHYEAMWSKRLFSVFMPSYVDVDNIALQPGAVLNTSLTTTATLMWSPQENTYMGLEYFYGKRENFNGDSGYDNRLNIIFRHMFNR